MKFEFGNDATPTKWLVQDMLPLGHLIPMYAQAGIGKSWFGEALAVSMVHGEPFLGKKTHGGDVLLIDQDTPTNTLEARLNRLSRSMGKAVNDLYVLSMKDLSLKDGSLASAVNAYPTATLVLIDSLHSVCVGLDTNSTKDMSLMAEFKSKCLKAGKTILIAHHISEKNTDTIDDLMFGEVRKLSMGNSVINQQADTYLIVGGSIAKNQLEKLYIRAVAKRAQIAQCPFYCTFENGKGDGVSFVYGGAATPARDGYVELVYNVFEKDSDWKSVNDCQVELKGLVGIHRLREILVGLHRDGKLLFRKEGPNKYMYAIKGESTEEVKTNE